MKGIIEDFPVMLASPNAMLNRISFPAFAQTKLDGMRANIIIDDGEVTLYSRNGKPMNLHGCFDHVADHVDNVVLDGELLVLRNGKQLDRKTGNGILHKAVVNTMSPVEATNIAITLWDIIDIDFWKKGSTVMTYSDRWKRLQKLMPIKRISLVDTYTIESLEDAQSLFIQKLKEGHEGLILKNIDHPWEDRRSPHLVKMKEVLEMDLRVIDWQPGTGKYEGLMGALVCSNKRGDIRVSVGTGFLDSQRKELTRDKILNKIITVKYNAVINSKDRDKKDKTKSLFLPVFVEVREDKDMED